MRGLRLACRANFICDNYHLLLGDNRLFDGLSQLREARKRINQTLRTIGYGDGFTVERIVLPDESLDGLNVRYLSVRAELGSVDAVLSGMEKGLSEIGVSEPNIRFVGFYHPALHFTNGKERRRTFHPDGRIFDSKDFTVVELNFANTENECLSRFIKGVLYVGLSERAFGTPNPEMIDVYHDSLLSHARDGGNGGAYGEFERVFRRMRSSFSKLSESLEKDVPEELKETEKLVADLVTAQSHA